MPPQGDIDGIGWSLPEFELLGYPETKQAYYIRCTECVRKFTTPRDSNEQNWAKIWMEEIQQVEKQWNGEGEEMMDIQTQSDVSSNTKKEVSPSTNTTAAEDYYCEEVVKNLHGGREIIVIDD